MYKILTCGTSQLSPTPSIVTRALTLPGNDAANYDCVRQSASKCVTIHTNNPRVPPIKMIVHNRQLCMVS